MSRPHSELKPKPQASGPEDGVGISYTVDLSSDVEIVTTFRAPLIAGAQPEDGVGLSEETKESSLCGG